MTSEARIFFAHANGFTPEAYEALLKPFRMSFEVLAPALLPLRTGRLPSSDWQEIANDLAEQIDNSNPVIGIGHSLGAVALLLAARQYPERFRRLVLIEPVAISAWFSWLLKHGPAALRRRGPLAQAARARVQCWASAEQAFDYERSRRRFARVSDEVLRDIVQQGICVDGEKVRLRFNPEWEASLYETPTSIWPLLRNHLPQIAILYGEHSPMFTSVHAARWRSVRTNDDVIAFSDAGHLLPLEHPLSVAAKIWDFVVSPAERIEKGQMGAFASMRDNAAP